MSRLGCSCMSKWRCMCVCRDRLYCRCMSEWKCVRRDIFVCDEMKLCMYQFANVENEFVCKLRRVV